MARPPLVGQGLLIVETSRSHSDTPPLDEWSARPKDLTTHYTQTDIHAPVGFEPIISAGERLQTHTLDRAATGIGISVK